MARREPKQKHGCWIYNGEVEERFRMEADHLPMLILHNCKNIMGVVRKLKTYLSALYNSKFTKTTEMHGVRLGHDEVVHLLKLLWGEKEATKWLNKKY